MKDKNLLHTIGEIDDRFIEEAAPAGKKKNAWYRYVAAAAACLVLVAGLLALPLLKNTQSSGRYKYTVTQREAAALVLRWEDRTLVERYLEMDFNGVSYDTRGLAIDSSLLGEILGTCDAMGFDHYSDQVYHQEFEVYEIIGIQEEKLVAVCMEDSYYVFRVDGYDPPATLGALVETYNLANNLPLSRFSHDGAYYILEDDTNTWKILEECADAPVVQDDDFRVSGQYVSFTATSEPMGIYKKVFYVTADGYIKTNILEYGYVYFIGADAAGRIIDHALTNATATEMEPYSNFVAGTITEIGDGYILVSDAVLCWKETDGIEYKVLTTDPVFARWFKYNDFQVGDMVYLDYRGTVEEGNVISGAYFITDAILRDGYVLVEA